MSHFGISDGKGFHMTFANGWCISVQFGYGNYCGNKEGHDGDFDEDYSACNKRLGKRGCSDAEVAVFDPKREMVKLPPFMFDDPEYADVVSGWNGADKVLELMNWTASQPKAA